MRLTKIGSGAYHSDSNAWDYTLIVCLDSLKILWHFYRNWITENSIGFGPNLLRLVGYLYLYSNLKSLITTLINSDLYYSSLLSRCGAQNIKHPSLSSHVKGIWFSTVDYVVFFRCFSDVRTAVWISIATGMTTKVDLDILSENTGSVSTIFIYLKL